MQLAQYVHATVGVILIAIMIAHIYIGSLGMEGAYDAMGSGEVDLAWARAHHSLWVEEQQAKTASGPQVGTRRTAPPSSIPRGAHRTHRNRPGALASGRFRFYGLSPCA
jgi:hypothetical protein